MTKPTTKKTFDCLKFKDKVHQEIAKETSGMTFDEYRSYLRKSAESGVFSDFYRKIKDANKPRRGARKAR